MAAAKYLLKISMFIHIIFMVTVIIVLGAGANAQLNPNYYKTSCGNVLDIIKPVVRNAVRKEARMAASLLRLHFHDCFVNLSIRYCCYYSCLIIHSLINIIVPLDNQFTNVLIELLIPVLQSCDGSLLLDDAPSFSSEKNAFPNKNSARGFDVIDAIKREVEKSCPGVVSCADILAIAARDAVVLSNGPYWNVHLGRRDSRTASINRANTNIPSPEFNVHQLISNFVNEGLSIRDLVALSGAHTIGQARCATFRDRVYNKTAPINPRYATVLEKRCPASAPRGDNNLSPLDMGSATIFDNSYFKNLKHERGLLRSDQALLSSASTASIVQSYIDNPLVFYNDFKEAMVKMGNIKPLTGNNGQIRKNCRRVNS